MKAVRNEKNNVAPYLEEKYGESFTLISYEMRSIDIPYDEAVCINVHGQKVKVYVEYQDEGVVMSDDYYGTLKMSEYYEIIRLILNKQGIAGTLFTQFNANYFAPQFNHETPLRQAMAEIKDQFYSRTTVFINEDDQLDEESFIRLCDAVSAENMSMYLAVYRIDDDTYGALDTTQQASKYIRSEDGVVPLFEEVIK